MASNPKDETGPAFGMNPGRLLEIKTRSVQQMSGNSNCLGVNISQTGSVILGVESADTVRLAIYDNGIWIPTNE